MRNIHQRKELHSDGKNFEKDCDVSSGRREVMVGPVTEWEEKSCWQFL